MARVIPRFSLLPLLPSALALIAACAADAPRARSRAHSGSGAEPPVLACDPAARPELAAGTCAFARTPVTLAGNQEVINAPSERLAAPPGGMWWIAEGADAGTVVATSDARGAVELDVVEDPFTSDIELTPLRVPGALDVGERLRLGCRELTVIAPLAAYEFSAIVLEHARRPDLGGTGFVVRLAPELRSRVFVSEAYVAFASANVQTGVHVLQDLLLADAPALCNPPVEPAADALFIPVHVDAMPDPEIGIGVVLRDTDDIRRTAFSRVCAEPVPSAGCYPSTRDRPR